MEHKLTDPLAADSSKNADEPCCKTGNSLGYCTEAVSGLPEYFPGFNVILEDNSLQQILRNAARLFVRVIKTDQCAFLLLESELDEYYAVQSFVWENGEERFDLMLEPVPQSVLQSVLQDDFNLHMDSTPFAEVLKHCGFKYKKNCNAYPVYQNNELLGVWFFSGTKNFRWNNSLRNWLKLFIYELGKAIQQRQAIAGLLSTSKMISEERDRLQVFHRYLRLIQQTENPQEQLQLLADSIREQNCDHVFLTFRDEHDALTLITSGMKKGHRSALKTVLNDIPDFSKFLLKYLSDFCISGKYYLLFHDKENINKVCNRFQSPAKVRLKRLLESNNLVLLPLRGFKNELIGIAGILDPNRRIVEIIDTLDILDIFTREATLIIQRQILYLKEKRMADSLREINRQKSMFLASVSHELKTPLTSICGFATALLEDRETPREETEKYLEIIQTEGMRLSRMIDQLLDMARIESGKFSIIRRKTNLEDILEMVELTLRKQIKNKNINFRVFKPANSIEFVGDRDRITQVLLNIIGNAIKFSKQEGKISVKVNCNGRKFFIKISDTGIGIKEEDIPRIFDKFFRSPQVDCLIPGTGIGLAISRQIVEAHHGSIKVDSVPGVGTTFTIALPLN